ncbi:hypothetical protein CHCC20335_4748 [Bacillus paralicheniformis]|nr:hypothetical protein CHCC20335_4748 [Bacillus paralicheniformis]
MIKRNGAPMGDVSHGTFRMAVVITFQRLAQTPADLILLGI